MNVFIVQAHPEPHSFNGALTQTAVAHLAAKGHEVVVSDLHSMNWQPVSGRHNFTTVADPDYFKQQMEELHATSNGGFALDIQQELDKLNWCDVLILQFPLSWFSMPAIMKGWVDRVFALGAVYGNGAWYDDGKFGGKRALLSVTTGGGATMYGPDGINGDMETLLFPIQHGILRLTGFDVLPPFISWQPAHVSNEERKEILASYKNRLDSLQTTKPLHFSSLHDFDTITFRRRHPDLATNG